MKYTLYEMNVLLEDAFVSFTMDRYVFGSEHRRPASVRFTHKKREEEKTELNCPMMENKSFMNAHSVSLSQRCTSGERCVFDSWEYRLHACFN